MKKIIPESGRELLGSPFAGIVGDEPQYNIDLGAPVTVDGKSWLHAWKGTTDVSANVISGSMTTSGNVLKFPVISGEVAAEYRYVFKVLVNGQYLVYYFRRIVERESGAK
jgi:hypothetical protein